MRFTLRPTVSATPRGKKVVIIGGGPAGLYAAGTLAAAGYGADVVDMLPEPGGLLLSGIPDLRMDKAVIREAIAELRRLGVGFRLGMKVGRDVELEELIRQYDATLIATGTWESTTLDVPGADLNGVHHALEYLVNYALAQHSYDADLPDLSGSRALVVGGGLTAVDACLVAEQVGAAQVIWLYRRGRQQAPAREADPREFDELAARVEFCELTQPVRFIGSDGRVAAVQAVKMRLGEKDSSGRPRPVPLEGSEFTRQVDQVLLALGEVPTPPAGVEASGIELNRSGAVRPAALVVSKTVSVPLGPAGTDQAGQYVCVAQEAVLGHKGQSLPRGTIRVDANFRTTREGVFAAGNVIDGPTQAGFASVEGMMVARHIAEYLETGDWRHSETGGALPWESLIV